ncbi:RNA recognition motif domain containing protein, putative [Babesia bigemina]|uniref:RNA recognition motif domain containing protein, putative n=1 Tax=Babesia bigemina TaxID=5866 RepID=A0A061D9X3_BABBI|nr:RNA recognition motif domain containing protein, putative [Babesia bigemina]CDR97298.1 RNA recognition motif domain containing protein, putative [Babesia bigemina]|eukprot:XP_012769484.1 RNA recognition motif domain containing protein, putative [Babesia bigemina]
MADQEVVAAEPVCEAPVAPASCEGVAATEEPAPETSSTDEPSNEASETPVEEPAQQESNESEQPEPQEEDQRASNKHSTPADDQVKFFVGGLHPSVDEEVIKGHFSKYGRIVSVQIMRDFSTGRSRGFGFITVVTQDNTEKVFTDDHILNGKRVDVRHMQQDPGSTIKRKIFVGGISKALSEQMLEDYFGRFGTIEKVIIMRQIDGSSRGFGFVVFAVDGAAEKVLESPSHFVYGSKVDVRAAETRSRQSSNRPDAYFKTLAQGMKVNGHDNIKGMPYPRSHHMQPPIMPPPSAAPVVGYDPQMLQQHMIYQQYAMQTQYAYYAQQGGAPGGRDPSRYLPHRPTNFGNQPYSQNNIARSYRPRPY